MLSQGGGCNLFVIIVIFLSAIFPVSFADAETPDSPASAWIQRLHDQGWDEETATEVVNLNQEWFASLAENAPRELDEQLARLSRLGKYPQFAFLLQKHPELAGLLAGSEDPRLLAKTLSDEDCYPYMTQQYSLQAAPDDALALAKALDRHSQTICHLAKRGIPGASALFIFPHETTAGQEYARWLDEVVRSVLHRSDDELAYLVSFIITEGNAIRQRMERDAEFRAQFRATLWPRLMRTVQGDAFSVTVAEPLIWDVLMLPEGETLLKDWGPEVPAQLLFGDVAYPKELHKTVILLMQNGSPEKVETLMRFAGEPALFNFLRRDLDWELMTRVLSELSRFCPKDFSQPCQSEWVDKLDKYNRLSRLALAEELKPEPGGPKMWIPFVSSYYTAKKVVQGREVSALDALFLALDIATVAIPVGKLAGNLMREGVKATGKTAAKEFGTTMTGQQLKNYSRDEYAKRLGRRYAMSIAENKLVPQAAKQVLKKYMPVLSKAPASIHQLTAFEVTKPVQFFFEKSHIGQATFKKLTGLEARVFMRGDAKVVIYPTRGIGGELLQQTAITGVAIDVASQTVNAIQKAWQKNASSWWLMNATNMNITAVP